MPKSKWNLVKDSVSKGAMSHTPKKPNDSSSKSNHTTRWQEDQSAHKFETSLDNINT